MIRSKDWHKHFTGYPMFEVKESNSEKKIYSTVSIDKGTDICLFKGIPIDYEETLDLGKKESFALQVERYKYIYLDEPFRFFNHSCDPNCGLTPDLRLIALKPIDLHEELVYDYSTTMFERHWTMVCECQKPNCRKIITDFDKLPEELQTKYIRLNIVQKYILTILDDRVE